MLMTRVIPCLLLKSQGLVKTERFRNPKYIGDPINAVKIFNEKEVDELMFLDITATVDKKMPSIELLMDIASECFMPVCYGGGIRTVEQIREIFNIGIEKAAINSKAVEDPEFIKKAAKIFGSQSIVAAIDVKKSFLGKYEVFIDSGTRRTKIDPVSHARNMEKMGAGEIFLNSIDRDGTMAGYDIELIRKVADSVSIPVIACGGAGKLEDFSQAVTEGHASAVAAGSYFVFHGKHYAVLINYPERKVLKKILIT